MSFRLQLPLLTGRNRRVVIIFGLVAFAAVAAVVCLLARGKPSPTGDQSAVEEGWVTHNDPRGFAVNHPESWQVVVNDWGLVRVGPDPKSGKGAVAFVATLAFPGATNNKKVLNAVLPDLKEAFPGFKITDQRALDKYQALICQIKYNGSKHVGAMLIAASGKNALISGLADEEANFNVSRKNLIKVLGSFGYDSTLQDAAQLSPVVQLTSWKDPNEGAFTLNVPAGWDVSGGLVRPYIDAGLKIVVASDDKGIQIENPYPPMYATPNWALTMAGFTEGSHYNPSGGLAQDLIVMGEKSAKEYISKLLPKYLGLTLKKVANRSDLAKKVPEFPWTTTTTAAEGTLTGGGKTHKAIVIEQGIAMGETGLWGVVLVHYWAPKGEIGLVEEIVAAMEASFVLDPQWAAKEQAEVAKRVGIISAAGSEIADMITSTFEYQSSVQDRAMRQWSNAMLGVEQVYNPKTGETYQVPSGAEYYWSDGANIVGTYVSEPPTHLDDWTELYPVE